MRPVVATALACAALMGCGDDSRGGSDPGPIGDPLVVYERSGGIAGIHERLEVELGGAATLTFGSGERQGRRALQLTNDELRELESALGSADLDEIEPAPGACADCFEYEITYGGETASFDDVAEVPRSVREAQTQLTDIVAPNSSAAGLGGPEGR